MSPTWPGLDALAARVRAAPPRLGAVRLVAVDGPAGSGKSTFARALADEVGRPRASHAAADGPAGPDGLAGGRAAKVRTVHLDDMYEGWTGLEGVWGRLVEGVLEPLAGGRPGRFRRYDWDRGAWDGWVDLPVPEVLVVEGCGAARRGVDGLAVLRVWVEADARERLARGLARDGVALREQWLAWQADEAAHFDAERTRERADVRLSTSGPAG